MKLAILVNDPLTEQPTAATTVIAHSAAVMGHNVFMIGVGDLTYRSTGPTGAVGYRVPEGGGGSQQALIDALRDPQADKVEISLREMDVLYLRYNPMENLESRPWEYDAGIVFGQAAVRDGVIVLSHPYTLAYALNKMYLEQFPAEIRPTTVVTRRYEEVLRFHEAQGGRIVLKPLRGYGGQDVYLVDESAANLKQIVQSIGRGSYVIAQEFLPEATQGDTRLFLFNARPLEVNGRYAAVRRVNETGDFRSNANPAVGGRPHRAEITPRMLEIAETLRPRLLADGIFDVGLDIVGDKLVEINTISAGGLNAASEFEGVPFGEEVVRMIERKIDHRRRYGQQVRNRALAVMD